MISGTPTQTYPWMLEVLGPTGIDIGLNPSKVGSEEIVLNTGKRERKGRS